MLYLLHHLLIDAAQRFPERTAVRMGDDSVTYGELDERSNRIAHALVAAACRPGDRVGILIPKSIDAVTAVYAAMKAGAAYVPLDPRAPAARLAYIVRDCGVQSLITCSTKRGTLERMFPDDSPLENVVVLDELSPEEAGLEAGSPPDVARIESDLAYLLYTSGSTGKPKGVMISHLSSLSFVRWAGSVFDLGREDRVSGHAPLHFDLSIFDLYATCQAGATLYPVPEGTSTFPRVLVDWIARNEITIWYSVPSILSLMVVHGNLERHELASLRTVLFAGEVFPVKYLRAWMQKLPRAGFYNLYGPTETNVITWYRVPAVPDEGARPVPIGPACANVELFARLDDGGPVTRPSEEGELYARGSCVANGYWGDPEKTRSVFLPDDRDPASPDPVYRTGDLVSRDESGNWIYLGRRDHMVKSRGYRIELGEVESVLYGIRGVKEAAVVAIADELIGHRIRAFVALDVGAATTGSELEAVAAESLPKYMMPDELELLERLPKTSTGKIDRQALSARPARRKE